MVKWILRLTRNDGLKINILFLQALKTQTDFSNGIQMSAGPHPTFEQTMAEHPTIELRHSIATRLLKIVFSVYFCVTVVVTVTHLVKEYRYTKAEIKEEIKKLALAFEPGLGAALWSFNKPGVESTIFGMQKIDSISGVKIVNDQGKEVASNGMVIDSQGGIKIVSKNQQAEKQTDSTFFTGMFGYGFPIYHTDVENITREVGYGTIYSKENIVIQRVQYGFILIVINAIIKTAALWIIFLFFVRKIVGKPLESLTRATERISLEQLDNIKINIQTKGRNELKILEETFNTMIQKLKVAKAELDDNAYQLEKRNHELSKMSTDLKHSNKRLTMILDNTKTLALVRNKMEAMVHTSHTILHTIPCSQSPEIQLVYHELQDDDSEGYMSFRMPPSLISSGSKALEKNKQFVDIKPSFTSHLPTAIKLSDGMIEETRSHLKEDQLHIVACRDQKLLGMIQIKHVNQSDFTVEHQEFVDTLSQFLSLTLEEIEMTQNLENKVKERTHDLEEALHQLNQKHTQLKNTQTQLVQAEKMAGLGTLVAGVAHEINNPVNFVYSGSQILETHLTKLKDYIFSIAEDDASEELKKSFEERFQRLFQFSEAILNGSNRIKTIVADLRTFSRLEEAEKKTVFIVESIESTIRLIQTEYKQYVDFQCDFQANPQIECWSSQLNQVFMNLMVNACQAIRQKQEETNDYSKGILSITTSMPADQLIISFQDTGCGMSEEVKTKIFEPFFTTKPVGEGTGLGMSISYGIVEKHQGKIEIHSVVGEGTTFTLVLPLQLTRAPEQNY